MTRRIEGTTGPDEDAARSEAVAGSGSAPGSLSLRRTVGQGLWALCGIVSLVLVFGAASAETFSDLEDGRSRGDKAAPLLLVEYSDFTCGYCKKFFLETWPRLKEKYVETGKVRFVYRDYPRADSGPGVEAAVAARCAGEQGQYWWMHDRLFSGRGRLNEETFLRHAGAIDLNLAKFTQCFKERPFLDAIFSDRAQGAWFGFRGTPGFVLVPASASEKAGLERTAVGIPGAFPYEVFEEQIERLLAEVHTPERG